MNLTYNKVTSDGVTILHSITFPLGYLSKDDVYVYVGEWADYQNQLSYTWVDANTIELSTPVPAGVEFVIRRVVPRADLKYYFVRTPVLGGYLDNEHLQLLMIMQEIEDGFLAVDGSLPLTGDLDMRGYRIFNLRDADVNFGDHAVNMKTLREFMEGQAVGGGSIISATPPPSTVNATRWWRCTDGKSFVRVQNSTGYGQWVEERTPINPPNYEITTVPTASTEVTITGEHHSTLLEFITDETIVVTVGKAVNADNQFVGALVFIQNTGLGMCTIAADTANGVVVTTNSSYKLEGQNSTVALMAKSETSWVLMGNLEVI